MCNSLLFLLLLNVIVVKSDYYIVKSNLSSNFTAYNSTPTSFPSSMISSTNIPTSISTEMNLEYGLDEVYAIEAFVDETETVSTYLVQRLELFRGAMISWPLSYYNNLENRQKINNNTDDSTITYNATNDNNSNNNQIYKIEPFMIEERITSELSAISNASFNTAMVLYNTSDFIINIDVCINDTIEYVLQEIIVQENQDFSIAYVMNSTNADNHSNKKT